MDATRPWSTGVGVAVGGLLLAACGAAADDTYVIENDPGKADPIAGSDLSRVSVTEQASRRLGIETEPVRRAHGGTVIPAEAVFVDNHGTWWVYTNEARNVFVRHEIEILRQNHRRVVLSSGPPAGTVVVTVGVAELYGIEAETGH